MTTTETKIKKPKATAKAGQAIKDGTTSNENTSADVAIKIPKVKTKSLSSKKDKLAKAGADSTVILRIRVRAYESKILDSSVKQIMDTAIRHDATIVGPVPLPTEIKKYTVNRSPFIYKNTREQFEIRVHKRLIDIINPNAKTIEALTNLSLPSGVDIDVKIM